MRYGLILQIIMAKARGHTAAQPFAGRRQAARKNHKFRFRMWLRMESDRHRVYCRLESQSFSQKLAGGEPIKQMQIMTE